MQSPVQTNSHCAALVLAAGGSTRLATPKQLLAVEGESLLHRTVRIAQEAGFWPVFVVIGAYASEVRAALQDASATLIENSDWQSGMGSSLRAGVKAVLEDGPPDHLLLLVCDQPALTVQLLQHMREQHLALAPPITAAVYENHPGVPAIFAQRLLPELLEITGDKGARDVLRRHATDLRTVPFVGGSHDIDVPEDLQYLNLQSLDLQHREKF